MLRQSTVVHGWLGVRVGHPQALRHVSDKQADQRDGEEEWLSSSEQEGHKDDVDDESQSIMDEELGSAIDCLKLGNSLCISLAFVARADRSLVNHALHVPDEPEEKIFDEWEDDVQSRGLGDKATNVQEPLGGEIGVDAREEGAFLRARLRKVPRSYDEQKTVVEE